MANIQGPIPHQLFKPGLTHFNVQGNRFTGTIPTEIGLSTALTRFEINGGNSLTGTIPTEIGNNSILRYL
jgi:hypothetical protein